jgi:UPF0716 protein FxsA
MGKLLLVAFLIYAAVEVAVLAELGRMFGVGWVLVWVVATILMGLGALRTQAVFALRRVATQLEQEILPTRELVDLALVVFACALLISPGILGDLFGLCLLIPVCRGWARQLILHVLPRWIPEEVPRARLRAAAANVIEIEREPHG